MVVEPNPEARALAECLHRVNLSHKLQTFLDEELDIRILSSMSDSVAQHAFSELGLNAEESRRLFLSLRQDTFESEQDVTPPIDIQLSDIKIQDEVLIRRLYDEECASGNSATEACARALEQFMAAKRCLTREEQIIQKRRAAAELGRELARREREKFENEMRRQNMEAAKEKEMAEAERMRVRQERANELAAKMESVFRLAPSPVQPPSIPASTMSCAEAVKTQARQHSTKGTPNDMKKAHAISLQAERKARLKEKELLLAEARSDQAYRMSLPQRWTAGVHKKERTSSTSQPSDYAEKLLKEADTNSSAAEKDPSSRIFCSVPVSNSSYKRQERITVRLPHGGVVQSVFVKDALVSHLVDWIASLLKLTPLETVEQYALLDRSTVPPRELIDECVSLHDAGLSGGATVVLNPRVGAAPNLAPALRPKLRKYGGTKRPESVLSLPDGTVGKLHGEYLPTDTTWRKAGMLVIVTDASPEGRELAEKLPAHLHFFCFTFSLPKQSESEDCTPAIERIYLMLRFLKLQHPHLVIRGLLGQGIAGEACLSYAETYGQAYVDTRSLVILSSNYGNMTIQPPSDWRILYLHGKEDSTVPSIRAELWHAHHAGVCDHTLRLLPGVSHAMGRHALMVATIINDWFEGAHRLTDAALTGDNREAGGRTNNFDSDDDDFTFNLV